MKFIAKQLGLQESNVSEEETIHNKRFLLKSLLYRISQKPDFDATTDAQVEAACNIIERYEEVPKAWGFSGIGGDLYMFLQFSTIYIGIEKDGYGHS